MEGRWSMAEEKEKLICKDCKHAESVIEKYKDAQTCLTILLFLISLCLIAYQLIIQEPIFWMVMTSLLSLVFAVGLILFHILPKKIIGKYVYFFKDKDGNVHCHIQAPIWIPSLEAHCWKTPPENVAQWNAEDFMVAGSQLELKFGGWFKKNAVVGVKHWYIRFKNGKIRLGDLGFEHARPKFDDLTPEQALDVINSDYDIIELFQNSLTNCDFQKRFLQAQAVQDDLGLQMFYMLIKIRQRRDSMGRSRHAKELRKDIEQALITMPNIYQKLQNWTMIVSLVKYDDARAVFEGLVKQYMPELADQLTEKEDQKKAANG